MVFDIALSFSISFSKPPPCKVGKAKRAFLAQGPPTTFRDRTGNQSQVSNRYTSGSQSFFDMMTHKSIFTHIQHIHIQSMLKSIKYQKPGRDPLGKEMLRYCKSTSAINRQLGVDYPAGFMVE